MPAYRSEAEAEVREAVVAFLRKHRPQARIMHEVNACSFGNRIDVLAVSPAEIVAAEIKSEKDKLDRLPAQAEAMNGCAHHVIVALHEKFLVEKTTNKHAAEYERDGVHYRSALPEIVERARCKAWVYPQRDRGGYNFLAPWKMQSLSIQCAVKPGALSMLWAEELRTLCAEIGINVPRRANMTLMTNALRWGATGRELTLGVCRALRRRECVEADPPIEHVMEAS